MSIHVRPGLIPLLTLLMISSCDNAPREMDSGVVVSDSAGVVMVQNPGQPDAAGVYDLSGPPLLRLGSDDGDAPDFFGRVSTAHLDSRGNVWVVDAAAAEVRVFSVPSGEHLFTLGGRGQGPGEFQMPFPIGFDAEHAWIWDQNLGRLSTFTLEGELVESRRVGQERRFIPRLLHRTEDGTFVAQLPELRSTPVAEGAIFHDTLRFWAFQSDVGEAELLATRQGVTWYLTGTMQVPIPFAQGTRFATREGRLVVSDPNGLPNLDVIEGGALARRIRIAREPIALTPEAIETELQSPVRSEAAQEIVRDHLPNLPIPEFVPTWEWVRIGSSGHVFALRFGGLLAEEVWDVFDPAGVLVGSVALPPEAHLVDTDHQYLVVMEMPEMRGPGVLIYPLHEAWTRP